MARQQESTKDKAVKKTRSSGGKKKPTAFNMYMRAEIARLKADQPEMAHKERFKLATDNWKNAKENPKRSA